MDLTDYRNQIDAIDQQIVALFQERMDISAEIGRLKQAQRLSVFQPEREYEKLLQLKKLSRKELEPYVASLYSNIFELSRDHQQKHFSERAED